MAFDWRKYEADKRAKAAAEKASKRPNRRRHRGPSKASRYRENMRQFGDYEVPREDEEA